MKAKELLSKYLKYALVILYEKENSDKIAILAYLTRPRTVRSLLMSGSGLAHAICERPTQSS